MESAPPVLLDTGLLLVAGGNDLLADVLAAGSVVGLLAGADAETPAGVPVDTPLGADVVAPDPRL